MKHPKWMAILAVITALSLAALACGGGGAAATDTPAPTKAPAATRTPKPTEEVVEPTDEPQPTEEVVEPTGEGVEIVNSRSYVDNYGYVHVVGLIRNNTADPVTNISLEVAITDENGETILRDGEEPVDTAEGYTSLYTIAPDNETPFDYWTFVPEGMEAAEYTVEIASYDEGDIDRGELDLQNAQMIADSDGNLYFSGELVNLSDQPVLVNSFAGAALDDDGNVLAADYTFSMNRYLYPAGSENDYDRTPFLVTLDGPADEATQWSAYWDADIADEQDGLGIDLEVTNSFYDDFGNLHLVGLATNTSNDPLYVSLVAGLYAEDGTVLDASTSSVPVYIQPGSDAPFQFQYFANVNYNDDQSELVDSYTIRVDRYWSYEPSFDTVELESSNEDVTLPDSSGIVEAAGEVTNSSNEDLSSIVVIVAIYDGDTLVGMEWTSLYPDGDAYAPGDTAEFDVSVYLDPNVDGSNFEFITYVQGYVK